ncbi:MAG: hypothetical protein MHM6MM_008752 [Cercozoa sp. M6MM]
MNWKGPTVRRNSTRSPHPFHRFSLGGLKSLWSLSIECGEAGIAACNSSSSGVASSSLRRSNLTDGAPVGDDALRAELSPSLLRV